MPTKKAEKKVQSPKAKTKSLIEKRAKKADLISRKQAEKSKVRESRVTKRHLQNSTAKKAAQKTNPRLKEKVIGHAPQSARMTPQTGPIRAVASRTTFASKVNNDRRWLLIDANDQIVGRLASEIANLLRGKHKSGFTPNNDVGDFVVVINAEKVKFTQDKETGKKYFSHSGYIGGLKTTTPARLREKFPERILESAVKGMVPRNPLGRLQMKKLKIYAGDKHPHAAQGPVVWNLRTIANK